MCKHIPVCSFYFSYISLKVTKIPRMRATKANLQLSASPWWTISVFSHPVKLLKKTQNENSLASVKRSIMFISILFRYIWGIYSSYTFSFTDCIWDTRAFTWAIKACAVKCPGTTSNQMWRYICLRKSMIVTSH